MAVYSIRLDGDTRAMLRRIRSFSEIDKQGITKKEMISILPACLRPLYSIFQQKAMEIAQMETAAPKRERRRIVQPHALRVASTAFSPLMFHSLE